MKTARNDNMDRVRGRKNARHFNQEFGIGTRVKLSDGTETSTWSHAGLDMYGACVVFVECRQEPVEVQFLTILEEPKSSRNTPDIS